MQHVDSSPDWTVVWVLRALGGALSRVHVVLQLVHAVAQALAKVQHRVRGFVGLGQGQADEGGQKEAGEDDPWAHVHVWLDCFGWICFKCLYLGCVAFGWLLLRRGPSFIATPGALSNCLRGRKRVVCLGQINSINSTCRPTSLIPIRRP